jgi:hypothetical protein
MFLGQAQSALALRHAPASAAQCRGAGQVGPAWAGWAYGHPGRPE